MNTNEFYYVLADMWGCNPTCPLYAPYVQYVRQVCGGGISLSVKYSPTVTLSHQRMCPHAQEGVGSGTILWVWLRLKKYPVIS